MTTATATATKKAPSITKNGVLNRASAWACQRETIRFDADLNRRQNYGELDALSRYIKRHVVANGYLPGVFVAYASPDQQSVNLTDGFRRITAYDDLMSNPEKYGATDEEIAQLKLAKFRIELEKDTAMSSILARQITANAGKPFEAFEQAQVFRDMEAEGLSRAEISDLTGVPLSTICERLKLLAIAPETAAMVGERGISATTTLAAVRKATSVAPNKQKETIHSILSKAADTAESEGLAVGKEHIEVAAVEVIARPVEALDGTAPDERAVLIKRCAEFSAWGQLSSKELRKVLAIIQKAPANAELPQAEAALAVQ